MGFTSLFVGFIILVAGCALTASALTTPGEQPLEAFFGGCLIGIGFASMAGLHRR